MAQESLLDQVFAQARDRLGLGVDLEFGLKAPTRLPESIKEVADGGAPMSHEVAKRVISLFRFFQ